MTSALEETMTDGNPYTPHTPEETAAMLDAVGVESEEELFDIPPSVAFEGEFGIPARSEQAIRHEIADTLDRNEDLVELLGRGHYDHYGPAVVDDVAGRSEFLTSYTQYQPEIAQGFLQALFEYQSLFVELTGLPVVNSSIYDAATALGEAATLSARVREATGNRILIPEHHHPGRRSVLENYVAGTDMVVETYPMADGIVDLAELEAMIEDDVTMVYVTNPTVRGVIEERLPEITALVDDHDALTTLGSDPVALSVLREPAAAGVDVVIGDAGVLGLPVSYGTGLGLFATRESFLRQVPGRLVGASHDEDDRRTFTLTLQTREQHIRRERATSNICTNQAWIALWTAMHITWLVPDGLVDLANQCVSLPRDTADRLDDIDGLRAPAHERHHFREFTVETDRPAADVAAELRSAGYAVHVIDEHLLQICVTDTTEHAVDGFVAAMEEVA